MEEMESARRVQIAIFDLGKARVAGEGDGATDQARGEDSDSSGSHEREGRRVGRIFSSRSICSGSPDRDTNPGGEAVAAQRADNDSLFLKATKDGVSIADFYHNKVGCPGDEAEIEFFKERVEPIATGIG